MATKDDNQRRAPQNHPGASNAPGVANTRPKVFQPGRLFLQLLTVLAIVLAFALGVSIFFKVDTVTVSGAQRYSAWTVAEASGIEIGDNLIFFGRAGAVAKIRQTLPYVRDARIGITLPGTVNIEIVEVSVVYSVRAQDGTWWLMTADGIVAEQTDGATANEKTVIEGITLASPAAGQKAVAYEAPPASGEGSQITATTNADRLNAALQIIGQLERNEILGEAASIDVSDLQNLQLWYGSRYQVLLGDSDRMDYKITAIKQAISQMGQFQTGILDATFTTLKDQVGYRAFD